MIEVLLVFLPIAGATMAVLAGVASNKYDYRLSSTHWSISAMLWAVYSLIHLLGWA